MISHLAKVETTEVEGAWRVVETVAEDEEENSGLTILKKEKIIN